RAEKDCPGLIIFCKYSSNFAIHVRDTGSGLIVDIHVAQLEMVVIGPELPVGRRNVDARQLPQLLDIFPRHSGRVKCGVWVAAWVIRREELGPEHGLHLAYGVAELGMRHVQMNFVDPDVTQHASLVGPLERRDESWTGRDELRRHKKEHCGPRPLAFYLVHAFDDRQNPLRRGPFLVHVVRPDRYAEPAAGLIVHFVHRLHLVGGQRQERDYLHDDPPEDAPHHPEGMSLAASGAGDVQHLELAAIGVGSCAPFGRVGGVIIVHLSLPSAVDKQASTSAAVRHFLDFGPFRRCVDEALCVINFFLETKS
ncbi:hypothetical protein THAOC_14179, partial [Thalassiosira oceanica]